MCRTACLCILATALCACGGGNGSGDGGQPPAVAGLTIVTSQVQACAVGRTVELGRALAGLVALARSAGDPGSAEEFGITITPTATPFEFNYSIEIDLDGDGLDDPLSGTIAFGSDPTGGFEPGDTAHLSFDASISDGAVTAHGELDLLLSATGELEISGTVEGTGADGCEFTITIPAEDPLLVSLASLEFQRALAIDVNSLPSIDISGCFDVSVSAGQVTFSGTLCPEGEELCMTDAFLNGQSLEDACFAIPPRTDPGFAALHVCAIHQFYILGNVMRAGQAVLLKYNDITLPGVPVTLDFPDPNDFDNFDFTVSIDLNGDGHAESLTGHINFGVSEYRWEFGEFDNENSFYGNGNMRIGGILASPPYEILSVQNALVGLRDPDTGCSTTISIVQGGDNPEPLWIEFDSQGRVERLSGGFDRYVISHGDDQISAILQFWESEPDNSTQPPGEKDSDKASLVVLSGQIGGVSLGSNQTLVLTIPGS